MTSSGRLIRRIGSAGTVLLKNTDGALPLLKPRAIVLVGSDAGPAKKGPNGYTDRGGLDGKSEIRYSRDVERLTHLVGILAQGWGSG